MRTHSIFKFNKMTFVWQNLDVSDVSAADTVEFPTKKTGMIPNDEGNVKIEANG